MATTTTEKSETKSDTKAEKEAAPVTERPRDPAREKAIDLAVTTIEKQFGKGSIMRLGEGMAAPEVKVVPSGSLGLDMAFAPLVPYSRVPLLLAVGAIKETPLAVDGTLVVAPVFKICATFDHRFIDGMHAAKMSKTVRHLLESDEGLDRIGLK